MLATLEITPGETAKSIQKYCTTSMKCSLPVPDHRLLCQPLWEYPSWINAQDEHVLASFGKARNTLQIQTGTGASWLNCFLTAHQSNPLTNLFYRTVQGSRNLTCRSISYYSYAWLVCSFVLKCISLQRQDVAKSFSNLGAKWQNVVKKHLSRAGHFRHWQVRSTKLEELLSESRVLKTFNGWSLIII